MAWQAASKSLHVDGSVLLAFRAGSKAHSGTFDGMRATTHRGSARNSAGMADDDAGPLCGFGGLATLVGGAPLALASGMVASSYSFMEVRPQGRALTPRQRGDG